MSDIFKLTLRGMVRLALVKKLPKDSLLTRYVLLHFLQHLGRNSSESEEDLLDHAVELAMLNPGSVTKFFEAREVKQAIDVMVHQFKYPAVGFARVLRRYSWKDGQEEYETVFFGTKYVLKDLVKVGSISFEGWSDEESEVVVILQVCDDQLIGWVEIDPSLLTAW